MSSPSTTQRSKSNILQSLRGVATDNILDGAFLRSLKQATKPLGLWRGLDHLNRTLRAVPLSRINPRAQNWRRAPAPAPYVNQQGGVPDFSEAMLALHMREHELAVTSLAGRSALATTTNRAPQQQQPQNFGLGLPEAPTGSIWAIWPCERVLPQPGFPRVAGHIWVPVGIEAWD